MGFKKGGRRRFCVVLIGSLLSPFGGAQEKETSIPEAPRTHVCPDGSRAADPQHCPATQSVSAKTFSASSSSGGGNFPWHEYDRHIRAASEVQGLADQALGDQINLQNGALSFSATDVALAGNSVLPVAFSRRYSLFNRRFYPVSDESLADWELDTPRLVGHFAPNWVGRTGSASSRCSDGGLPPPMPDPNGYPSETQSSYWQGLQLHLPGMGSGELLLTLGSTPKPQTGSYPWVTNGLAFASCLTTIKNGAGEGFLVVTPDGTRYWFDWLAQNTLPVSYQVVYVAGLPFDWAIERRKNTLYATRVEDRHGNWVTYTYTNAWNAPARLSEIQSNDGRRITVSYSAGFISAVNAVDSGNVARTWQYAYASTASGRQTLTQVTLPDAAKWQINFASFTNAEIQYLPQPPPGEPIRDCMSLETPLNWSLSPVGTLTHPSGMTGTFVAQIKEHGRTNVPVSCANFTIGETNGHAGNDPNDDHNLFVGLYHAFSVTSRAISGPGLGTHTWQYDYTPSSSFHFYPGTTYEYPICVVGAQCYEPPCVSDTCAGTSITSITGPDGSWERHTFGNSFKYNEGKLIATEEGSGPQNIVRSTTHRYDLARSGRPYPVRFGDSLNVFSDSSSEEFLRPTVEVVTKLQGRKFKWQVETCSANFCIDQLGRPTKTTKSSTPDP